MLRSKRIGATNLTFPGHMTLSITWPFDSPQAISYWWSFGTKPLSPTVSEIFNGECDAMAVVELRGARGGLAPWKTGWPPRNTWFERVQEASKRPPEITCQIQYILQHYQYHSKHRWWCTVPGYNDW